MLTLEIRDKKYDAAAELGAYKQAHAAVFEAVCRGESCYEDSLGWLHVDTWANDKQLQAFEALAAKIRDDADVFVIIGVGGSNNSARSVIEAFKDGKGPEIVYAGNTLSPHALCQMLKRLQGKSVYIDCIAKNFETLEPGSSFRILRKYLYDTYGEAEAARRIIATGTKDSRLHDLCREHGYTFLEFPLDVGGRYTAMTGVSLLPMAVAGIDIRALVDGAKAMERSVREEPAEKNMAYTYAALRNIYLEKGYALEMLAAFEPQLRWFYKWWIQLFGETEGKEGKGLFPVCAEYSEELHAVGQFVQEGTPLMFETFLNVKEQNASLVIENDGIKDAFDYLDGMDFWDINKTAFEATIKAHETRLPCLIFHLDRLDAWHFGQMFYFFMFACALSARLLGVNPFDQPGVEAYKKWMFDGLGK